MTLLLILQQCSGGWKVQNCETKQYYSIKPLTYQNAKKQRYAIKQEHLKQLKTQWRNNYFQGT